MQKRFAVVRCKWLWTRVTAGTSLAQDAAPLAPHLAVAQEGPELAHSRRRVHVGLVQDEVAGGWQARGGSLQQSVKHLRGEGHELLP